MGRTFHLPKLYILSLLLAAGLAGGCGGRRAELRLQNELSELKFDRSRGLAALKESLVLEREATAASKLAHDEKEAAIAELSGTREQVRYLTEHGKRLTSEKVEQEKSLNEARESERKLRDNHEKLMELASATREEVTDLRLRAESSTAVQSKMAVDNQSLRHQLEVTSKELEEVKGELTRTRAVVRSFQEAPASSSPVELALRARVAELERAIEKASQSAPSNVSTEDHGSTAAATPQVVARPASTHAEPFETDPWILWSGFKILVRDRWRSALKGEFRGDAFEWGVAAIAGLAFVFFVVWLLGVSSRQRLRRQIAQLKAPQQEAAAASEPAQARASAEAEPARQPNARRSFRLPREERDFSAIISSPRAAKKTEEPERVEKAEAAPEPRRPAEKASVRQADKGSFRSPEKPSFRPPEKGSFRAAEPRPRPAAPSPERERPPERAAAPASKRPGSFREGQSSSGGFLDFEEEDDEMANTQIINPMALSDAPPSKPKKGGHDREDADLLDELKSVINRKIDEMMK